MESSNFTLYNASAGSGKTYALTKAYLTLVLSGGSPAKFRQLLALTFTNKAVGEMKTRILDNLYDFAKKAIFPNQNSLFRELCHDLSLTPKQLQLRSQQLLKRILHNYSFFEISTIDKFNHKIVKTFARDLQLSHNFEVELNTGLLLEEAVGRLLERAGSEEELTKVLLAFSLEKIDEDKSWDITYDLIEIGQLLFQENHATAITTLRYKSILEFQELQQHIAAQIHTLEVTAVEAAQHVLREIETRGFVASDFPRQTLPKHFTKIAAGEFRAKILYNNTLEQQLREGKLLKVADKRDVSHLATVLLDTYLTLKNYLYQRSVLKNKYNNIVPLTVLNEIAREIKTIEMDRDIIPISSLNTILAKEIKDQPVPFIYERIGEKYRHYFIDEFQDTSQMQWHNLIPLIGNALEGEDENQERGSLFLVGDVKQAIYRWRGGKAEQFLHLLQSKSNPFVVPPAIHTLDTNWRSYDEIVHFNNHFFATIAPVLQNEAYQNLFAQGSQQKTNCKPGGFVQLSFMEKDPENKDEAYCKAVLDAIEQVTSHNYPYADLCILVRDNKTGRLVADFLAQHNIPIVSSEALLLHGNETVGFLIALLNIMENPADQEAAYQTLSFLAKGEGDPHTFIYNNLNRVERFLATRYGFYSSRLKGQAVYSILENAVIQFNLADKAPAYLMGLMDEVLVVEKRSDPGIHTFLTYWEQKKASLSIAVPDHINAVKIMTIHKAKGLEFPFVIFPFANTLLNDTRKKKKVWIPATPTEQELGLKAFLVNNTQDLLEYNPQTAQVYQEEVEKTKLDAINVLYVALTRAEKGLYIVTESGKEVAAVNEATSYVQLFRYYLQQQGIPEKEQEVYTFGTLPNNPHSPSRNPVETRSIPYVTRVKEASGFTIATTSGSLWYDTRRQAVEMGNIIHQALENLKTEADIPQVLENLKTTAHLNPHAVSHLQHTLYAVVRHPELRDYFSGNYEVWNEREILTPEGVSLRPDRVVRFQKQLILFDYKTGKPSPSHREQIARYIQALEAMDFEVIRAIIVYIGRDIKVNVVM